MLELRRVNAQLLTTALPVMIEFYAAERWLPVVGFEGLYEVSDHGRVRSVDRVVKLDGHPKLKQRTMRGRILFQKNQSPGSGWIVFAQAGGTLEAQPGAYGKRGAVGGRGFFAKSRLLTFCAASRR
jgi:hypothetical protein